MQERFTNGVSLSTNNGGSWTSENDSLTNTDIRSLTITGTDVFAGTLGSGLWKRSLSGLPGINEFKNSRLNIEVFPNPATANINIKVAQPAIIEITNVQGQLIRTLETTGNMMSIDVSSLPSGMYIVTVKTVKEIEVGKFVKE